MADEYLLQYLGLAPRKYSNFHCFVGENNEHNLYMQDFIEFDVRISFLKIETSFPKSTGCLHILLRSAVLKWKPS